MSNKTSTDLFDLIKSLNKSEKRYFKIFSSRHTIGKENNYILLFDTIESMDVYDEDVIFKKFEGEAFLNKFSITKGRLYDNVLRSLDSYHSQSSIESQIFRLIHSADILYKKSLYDQCLKLLRSASKLAKKHDRFTLLLEIHLKKKKLVENRGYMNIKEQEIDQFWNEEQHEIGRIKQYFNLWHVKSKLFYQLNKNGKARNEEELNIYKNHIDLIKDIDIEHAYFDTKYLYNHIYSAYHFSVGDLEKSYQYLKANIDLYQGHKEKIADEPNIYYSILTNAIFISSTIGKEKESQELLIELKEFPEKYSIITNEDLDIKIFSSSASLELSLNNKSNRFSNSLALASKINEAYRIYGDKISAIRKAHINFQMCLAYFAENEFNEALKWNNEILNDKALNKSDDLYCFSLILNLIIHFELQNHRLIPYALKSVKRILNKRSNAYQFEKVFLKHINKLLTAKDLFEFQEKLDKVHDDLIDVKSNSKTEIAFEYFDFISWVNSKRKNITYKEAMLAA